MHEIVKYNSEYKSKWNDFILSSRNGSFLFLRDYMDYHNDRFLDCSFLFIKNGNVAAAIAGNTDGDTYYSHQGLTYGGLITSRKIVTTEVIEIFKLFNSTLKEIGIAKVIYKPIPMIYHTIPSQEDIYVLFRLQAKKTACYISSTLLQNNKIRFSESRRGGIKKAHKEEVNVQRSTVFDDFWKILTSNLEARHGNKPAHAVEEIKLLASRFPENIQLFVATVADEIVAGVVIYLVGNVAHVQYIAANEIGKSVGALDMLFDHLINKVFVNITVFDFGHSNEQNGIFLNEQLIFQKEGFGGRGVVYEIYEYFI